MIDVLVQVSSSPMDLRVRVPLLEAVICYARWSDSGVGLIGKGPHV